MKGIPEKNGIILRPALQFTKSLLLEYVNHHKIKIGIDSSNLASKYERNYLRNEVFNKISSKFPDFEKGFTNSIQFLKKDYLLLNELVQKIINPQIEERKNYLIINFDNSIPKQAWYHFFKRFGFNFSQVNHWVVNNPQSGKHIESLTHKLSADRNKWILSKRNFKKLNNEIFEIFENQKTKTPILLEGRLTCWLNHLDFSGKEEPPKTWMLAFPPNPLSKGYQSSTIDETFFNIKKKNNVKEKMNIGRKNY